MWLVRGGRDRRQRVSVQGNGTAEDYGKKDLGPRFSSEAFFVATARAGNRTARQASLRMPQGNSEFTREDLCKSDLIVAPECCHGREERSFSRNNIRI